MYPRLRTLGGFAEGQLAQVKVSLWTESSTLHQLLPATEQVLVLSSSQGFQFRVKKGEHERITVTHEREHADVDGGQ